MWSASPTRRYGRAHRLGPKRCRTQYLCLSAPSDRGLLHPADCAGRGESRFRPGHPLLPERLWQSRRTLHQRLSAVSFRATPRVSLLLEQPPRSCALQLLPRGAPSGPFRRLSLRRPHQVPPPRLEAYRLRRPSAASQLVPQKHRPLALRQQRLGLAASFLAVADLPPLGRAQRRRLPPRQVSQLRPCAPAHASACQHQQDPSQQWRRLLAPAV